MRHRKPHLPLEADMAGKKKTKKGGPKPMALMFLALLIGLIVLPALATRSEAAGWDVAIGPFTANTATPTAYLKGSDLSYTAQGVAGMTLARITYQDRWVADLFTPQGFGAVSNTGAATAVGGVELLNLLGIRIGAGYVLNEVVTPDGTAPGR